MGNAAAHGFWSLITLACLVWYSTVAVYVAIRGTVDIRTMLTKLRQDQLDDEEKEAPPS